MRTSKCEKNGYNVWRKKNGNLISFNFIIFSCPSLIPTHPKQFNFFATLIPRCLFLSLQSPQFNLFLPNFLLFLYISGFYIVQHLFYVRIYIIQHSHLLIYSFLDERNARKYIVKKNQQKS